MNENDSKETVIGVDLGGTRIKTGLVDRSGKVSAFRSFPTESEKGPGYLLEKLKRSCEQAVGEARLLGLLPIGIGIGTAGFVDADGHIAYATDNLRGWTGTRLRSELEQASDLPVSVLNDVHAAALGEAWKGGPALLGLRDFVCITLGTGIGGCLIEDGRIVRGRDGYAGGFGHQIVQSEGGLACGCGASGCWEMYASVNALKRLMVERAGRTYEGLPITGSSRTGIAAIEYSAVDPRRLFDSARSGDRQAVAIVDEYAARVATGLVNLIHALNPGDFVIGGAIAAQGRFLLDRIAAETERRIMPVYRGDGIRFHAATLGEYAGVVGAAQSLLQRL